MAEEGINFDKLQKEFYNAKEADQKYSRENDAKFRAVHQKVASYEEFRDIVTASHLQPLDRDDITGMKNVQQPWNTAYNTDQKDLKHNNIATSSLAERTNGIKTRDDFLKTWSTVENKVEYILSFDMDFLRSVFKCDIPFNFLETYVKSIKNDLSIDSLPKIINIFKVFTLCERFSLTLKFLGKKDKEELKSLLETIEKNGHNIDEVKNLYGLWTS